MYLKNQQIKEGPIYRKKQVKIWKCSQCIGWMQKEFSFSSYPSCPFCDGDMLEAFREINVLVDESQRN